MMLVPLLLFASLLRMCVAGIVVQNGFNMTLSAKESVLMKPGSGVVSVDGNVNVDGELQVQNENILSFINEQRTLISQMNETIQQQSVLISQMNETIERQSLEILRLQQQQPKVYALLVPHESSTVIPPGTCSNFIQITVHVSLAAGFVDEVDYMGYSLLTVLMNGNPIYGGTACSGGRSDIGVWGRGERYKTSTGASFSSEFYYSKVNDSNTVTITTCVSNNVSYVHRAEYTIICF